MAIARATKVRMPSLRWQKWGGSTRPFPILGSELKADRPTASKELGNPFDTASSMDLAPAEKKQSLKAIKPSRNVLSQRSRYRNV